MTNVSAGVNRSIIWKYEPMNVGEFELRLIVIVATAFAHFEYWPRASQTLKDTCISNKKIFEESYNTMLKTNQKSLFHQYKDNRVLHG